MGESTLTPEIRRALRDNPDLRPAHIFAGMPYALRPERARGVRAVYLFEIEGEGAQSWTLRVADGACETAAGRPDRYDVRIACDAGTFLDLATGVVRPGEAFVDGRLRVSGDLALAMRVSKMFTS